MRTKKIIITIKWIAVPIIPITEPATERSVFFIFFCLDANTIPNIEKIIPRSEENKIKRSPTIEEVKLIIAFLLFFLPIKIRKATTI